MISDLGVLYGIIVGVVLFGVISAYLIYTFVQQEKREYKRNWLQRERLSENPVDYDLLPSKERKPSPALKEVKSDKSPEKRVVGPLPAPLLAPVVLPPLPAPSPPADNDIPEKHETPRNSTPPINNDVITPATAATATAAVATTAAATYDLPPKEPKPKSKPKPEESKNQDSDFDDYRHFSPTNLPPPIKDAPPPKASYKPASGSPQQLPVPNNSDVTSVEIERSTKPRNGVVEYPRVAVPSNDGLEF